MPPQSDTPTVEERAAAEVAALGEPKTPKGITKEQIREKVLAGLTREQAVEVLERQAKHDAELSDAEASAGKPKKTAKADK